MSQVGSRIWLGSHHRRERNPQEIESLFRLWAFNVYYTQTYGEIRDPLVRFVKALVMSANDIADPQAVQDWYEAMSAKARLCSKSDCLEEIMLASLERTGRKPPPKLVLFD